MLIYQFLPWFLADGRVLQGGRLYGQSLRIADHQTITVVSQHVTLQEWNRCQINDTSQRERDKERDRLRERQTGRERDRNRDRERDSYKYGDSKIFYVNTAEFMDSDKNAKLNIQYWYCIHFFFSLNKLDSKIGLWLFYNNNLLKTQTPTLKLPGKIGEENVFCTYCSRYFFLWVGIRCVFLTCRYQIYTELHQGVTQQNHVVYSVKGCSVSKRLK